MDLKAMLDKEKTQDTAEVQQQISEALPTPNEDTAKKLDLNQQAGELKADETAKAEEFAEPAGGISTGVTSSITGQENPGATIDNLLRSVNKAFDNPNAPVQHGLIPTVMPSELPAGYYTVHKGSAKLKNGTKYNARTIGGRFFFSTEELEGEDELIKVLDSMVESGLAEKNVSNVSAE